MQSEHLVATSPDHRTAHSDLCTNQHAKQDIRRFATIFPVKISTAATVGCAVPAHEDAGEDSDDPLQWEFVVPLTPDAKISSAASVDQSSTLSAAQRVIARYRAVHGDSAPECAPTEIKEKTPSELLDDQRSMYTVATSADTQPTMDMLWRPKPKVHMRRADQRALIQAQSQAIAMMNDAGLKPKNKIQCRRRGCADILPDVEALKYHLHIHNIADSTTRRSNASALHKSLVELCTHPKPSKSSHSRSISSPGSQQTCLASHSASRKLSAGSPIPSLSSPCGSTPEDPNDPSLATVTKALVSNPIASSTAALQPSRGRRTRKGFAVSSDCIPAIATLLSPPPSPTIHSCLALDPDTDTTLPLSPNPAMESENHVPITNRSAQSAFRQLAGSRSCMRALSPSRAMSPIRNGIKRVLSIGRAADFTDE